MTAHVFNSTDRTRHASPDHHFVIQRPRLSPEKTKPNLFCRSTPETNHRAQHRRLHSFHQRASSSQSRDLIRIHLTSTDDFKPHPSLVSSPPSEPVEHNL
ncbi:hypothetical protein Bca4012_011233 [Brassica carinata]